MATHDEIQTVLDLLIDEYKPELSDEKIAVLFEAWAGFEYCDLRAAALRHMNNCEFFPRLAEINALVGEVRADRRTLLSLTMPDDERRRADAEYLRIRREMELERDWVKCEACHGGSALVRRPSGELITLAYWRYETSQTVPYGQPTKECPWEQCWTCGGVGMRPPAVDAGDSVLAALSEEPVELREAKSA